MEKNDNFIAAGSVVTKDVPDYGLIVGVPGKLSGYMSRHGHRLKFNENGIAVCKESGFRYKLNGSEVKCMDWDEDKDLPEKLKQGGISFTKGCPK